MNNLASVIPFVITIIVLNKYLLFRLLSSISKLVSLTSSEVKRTANFRSLKQSSPQQQKQGTLLILILTLHQRHINPFP